MIILGGGLAGCAAALRAAQLGQAPVIIEKSSFPRHKVCGEFLSPEVLPLLDELGVSLQDTIPAPIRRVILYFENSEKRFTLPEAAMGLSRYRLDEFLQDRARSAGATVLKSTGVAPQIVATGRHRSEPKGFRLFGFKAHFRGPVSDMVELFFFNGGYVGVNPVEDGLTNVCGLAPESSLKQYNFDVDAFVHQHLPLRRRLEGVQRQWDWLFTGPLVFGNELRVAGESYPAGDALSFVDPFTGSGMLAALRTGKLAAEAVAQGDSPGDYLASARARLERPFFVSSMCRKVIWKEWGPKLAQWVPGRVLFALTRP